MAPAREDARCLGGQELGCAKPQDRTSSKRPVTPLQVMLLSDGRPGHYHLAEGVCAALRRLRPVDVTRLAVHRRRHIPSRVSIAAMRAGVLAPARALRLAYGISAADLPRADLVISAGGDTIAANVAVARQLGIPNIYCGTLKHATPGEVALTVSSYARHARLPGHIVCLKPTAMDPDTLGRPVTIPAFGASNPPKTAALLIGGDSGLFRYADAEWNLLLAFIGKQHAAHGTRWLVSTSRRTPDGVADRVARLFADFQGPAAGSPFGEVLDYRSAGPGTLPGLLARADVALCTEDSSTMISEAIAARLPVVGVAPLVHAFKPEEAEYRALMIERGWARFVPIADLDPGRFLSELEAVTPLAGNHLTLLAAQLAERLPALVGER